MQGVHRRGGRGLFLGHRVGEFLIGRLCFLERLGKGPRLLVCIVQGEDKGSDSGHEGSYPRRHQKSRICRHYGVKYALRHGGNTRGVGREGYSRRESADPDCCRRDRLDEPRVFIDEIGRPGKGVRAHGIQFLEGWVQLVADGDHIENASSPAITAQCLRVPCSDGHMAACFVSFKGEKPSIEQIKADWAAFSGRAQELNLPSARKQFLHYFEEADRPQTKLDRNLEGGMAVSIGRLRPDTQYDYKFVCLSHNTLRGAAGGAVLLAELLCAEGYIAAK